MSGETTFRRGISPVIGTILIVAIVVLLVSVWGAIIFGLTERTDDAPDVAMQFEQTDGATHTLVHQGGDTLTGGRVTILGVTDSDALHGRELTANDRVEVIPVDEEVRLIWEGNNTDHTLHTFDVDPRSLPFDPGETDRRCPTAETNIEANGDLDLNNETVVCRVTEDVDTSATNVDIDLTADAAVIGDIDTDGDINLDGSMVVGDVTTNSDDITVTGASEVFGDIVAQPDTNIDIDGDSTVEGAVVARDGSLSLNDVTVTGHVYADGDDLSCSGTTTIGPDSQPCAEYDPLDPDSY